MGRLWGERHSSRKKEVKDLKIEEIDYRVKKKVEQRAE